MRAVLHLALHTLHDCLLCLPEGYLIRSYICEAYTAETSHECLQADWILVQLVAQRKEANARYIDFVRERVGLAGIWQALIGQVFLGSGDFKCEGYSS